MRLRRLQFALPLSLLLAAQAMTGCAAAERDQAVVSLVRDGQYAKALERAKRLETKAEPGDRSFLLSKMRIPPLALAEGVPGAAREDAERVFDVLRTSGLNKDRTIGAFFLTQEGTQIWKGDPFEQALAFSYIAMLDATTGEWGNVRAAANNSLFQLRDFSSTLQKSRRMNGSTGDQVNERLALVDAASRRDPDGRLSTTPDTLPVDYSAVLSDFELGYVLKALACRQINEVDELREVLGQLVQAAPQLRPLADTIGAGRYNAVLVVSFGIGPEKYADGPDRALAVYRNSTPSGQEPLIVRVNGEPAGTFPLVTDVNRMARDLKWNNLEDLRKAKSLIGNVLIAGGAVAIAADGNDNNRAATYAGIGAILAGLALKATAVADTRQCDAFPQRFYVAPITLPTTSSTVEVSIGGSRLVLPAMPPASPGTLPFRYVRLPGSSSFGLGSGRILYSNDLALADISATPDSDPASNLPYILGGRDVRTPTQDALSKAQRMGLLRGLQFQDILDLYKAEGIKVIGVDADATGGRHVLEGGDWLYTPLGGTAGFARLYGQEHAAYEPRSDRVKELNAREREILRSLPLGGFPTSSRPATDAGTVLISNSVGTSFLARGPSPQEPSR
jgi:hypothetical protein